MLMRVFRVWWFGWLVVTLDGATLLPPPPQPLFADEATCRRAREIEAQTLAALRRDKLIADFEVHDCENLDRTPR